VFLPFLDTLGVSNSDIILLKAIFPKESLKIRGGREGGGVGGYFLPFYFGFGIFYLFSSSPWDGSCRCFHPNHWFDVFMVVTFNHPKLKVIMTPYHSVPNFTTWLTPWWWSSTNVLSSCIIKTMISFFFIQKILHSLGKRDQSWCTWFVLMKVGVMVTSMGPKGGRSTTSKCLTFDGCFNFSSYLQTWFLSYFEFGSIAFTLKVIIDGDPTIVTIMDTEGTRNYRLSYKIFLKSLHI